MWTTLLFNRFVNRAYNAYWIHFNGLRNFQVVNPKDFIDRPRSIQYARAFQVVWLLNLRKTLKFLEASLDFSTSTFVDLGCGTGISTLYASKWPFAQLIGIDFQNDLIQKARLNLHAWPEQQRVEFISGDASDWKVNATNGIVVLFLFNPFDEPILHDFLGNNFHNLQTRCVFILVNDKLRSAILENYPSTQLFRHSLRQISVIKL